MNNLPLSALPTPPEVINITETITRVFCFRGNNPNPEEFNYNVSFTLKFISRFLPKDILFFQVQIVTKIITFTKGKKTGEKEDLSDVSRKYFMTEKFE